MTPPAAIDGAEFLRLANKFRHLADSLCGIIDADPVESALRYAATLAGELERARKALIKYGDHSGACSGGEYSKGAGALRCDCGYADALKDRT